MLHFSGGRTHVRERKRVIKFFLLLCCASNVLPDAAAQSSNVQPAPRRKTKVDVKFEASKNLTTVTLVSLSLWEGLSKLDSVDLEVSFTYPGHTIVTPKTVRLVIYGSNDSGIEFNAESKLLFVLDNVRMDVGKMKLIHSVATRGEYVVSSFQVFELSTPYDQFIRIAKANGVKVELDERKYNLSSKNLQAIRDFAELMQQSGQEFK